MMIRYFKAFKTARLLCFVLTMLGFGMAPSLVTAADDFPSKPITLVVPYPPGGTADLMARLLANEVSAHLKKGVVVVNRGGASGNIAAQAVATAPADGYTLIMGNAPILAINPHLYKKPGFDPIKDFEPITPVADVPLFLIANPKAPYNSVAELVSWAKQHPEKMNYASGSAGSTTNLAMELFKTQAMFTALHVPYKGSGPALTALVAGDVPVMFELMPTAMGFIKSGQVKALAVTSRARQGTFPNIPTVAESGYPGFEVASWFGVLAPAGTPKPVVALLHKAITAAASSPQFQARLLELGAAPMTGGPEEFGKLIKAELVKWESIVKASGATSD